MTKIRQRGNSFQLDVVDPATNKRIRKSFKSREEAEGYGRAGIKGVYSPLFHEFVEQVFNRVWDNVKNPDVIRSQLVGLKGIIATDELLIALTSARVEQILLAFKDRGLANGTINNRMTTLRKLLKYAERVEMIGTVPRISLLKVGKPRDFVLSVEKEREVLELCKLSDSTDFRLFEAYFMFLLYTGCRSTEARNVERSRDVREGRVTFRDTKNGTNRTIKLPANALWGWNRARNLSSKPYPFRELPIHIWRARWSLVMNSIGLGDMKDCVPHSLRHTCITRLIIKGVPLVVVKEWAGHNDIKTTLHYAHLAPTNLDVAADALDRAAMV